MEDTRKSGFAQKLSHAQQSGVALYLDGRPSSPDDIAARYVCENTNYMADYVLDPAGKLRELRYDRVTNY